MLPIIDLDPNGDEDYVLNLELNRDANSDQLLSPAESMIYGAIIDANMKCCGMTLCNPQQTMPRVIDELTIQYSCVSPSAITVILAEIVVGASALE